MIASAVAAVLAASAPLDRPVPRFPVAVERVRLDVLALDRGAPLRGLVADDLEVRDNGLLQRFQLTAAQELPWELILGFDTSASVKGEKLDRLRACGRAVIEGMREGDRAALITFSHRIEVRCPMTADRGRLLTAVAGLESGGSTALFDGLFAALALHEGTDARPLVLLFTDGRDNASWLTGDDVMATARVSDIPVFAVTTTGIGVRRRSILDPPTWSSIGDVADDGFLEQVTRATGGRLFRARSAASLERRLARAMDEIGARYLIAYTPSGAAQEGWHTVAVRLRSRRGTVVVRPGYAVPRRPR